MYLYPKIFIAIVILWIQSLIYTYVVNNYWEGQFGIKCGNHVFKDRLNVAESLYKRVSLPSPLRKQS